MRWSPRHTMSPWPICAVTSCHSSPCSRPPSTPWASGGSWHSRPAPSGPLPSPPCSLNVPSLAEHVPRPSDFFAEPAIVRLFTITVSQSSTYQPSRCELSEMRKDKEREEEVTEEPKRFTTQGTARGFSLFEEALLVSEAQNLNVEQYTKVAAAVQNVLPCHL